MDEFGLIIQETTAGSTQQFVSSHLDINNPEIKGTITDERTLACQLANSSDAYSVQITKNYKIYSLIVTNFTDFLGRSGYYAIRLYCAKNVNLNNFERILSSIKDKYNDYNKSNNLGNQNYDDILSSILIVENDKRYFIALKNTLTYVYYFDDTNSTLSTVFNAQGINLVNKVYAFNKNKAVLESIAISSGLKPFEQVNASIKEIVIINNHGVLNELKINGQNVEFNSNASRFYLLCYDGDSVSYNTLDDKNLKSIEGTTWHIEKKVVPPKFPSSERQYKKPGFFKKYGVYLAILLLGGVIAVGVLDLNLLNLGSDDHDPGAYTGKDSVTNADKKTNDTTHILFESEPDSVYTTKYPKLEKYRFKFADTNWVYKNTKRDTTYIPFYRETINKMDTKDSLNLGDSKKKEFIKNLETTSGHPIKEKPIVLETSKVIEKKKQIDLRDKNIPDLPKKAKVTTPKREEKNKNELKVKEGSI